MKKIGSLFVALGLAALAGCSSAPKSAGQLSMDSRDSYLSDVKESLNKWDGRADKVRGDRAVDLRASIRDTRAEVRALEAAPSDNWQAYRSRINNRMDHIQQVYNQARAE
jgi:hypothetical protein